MGVIIAYGASDTVRYITIITIVVRLERGLGNLASIPIANIGNYCLTILPFPGNYPQLVSVVHVNYMFLILICTIDLLPD